MPLRRACGSVPYGCLPPVCGTQWTSCAGVKPLCVPELQMNDIICNADAGRAQISGLNTTLAAHHDHVKALCAKAASHIDPNTYREALRTLENQIQHIRCMYEQELNKMRQQLDTVNQDRGCLVSKAGANSNLASSLQARLASSESVNEKAHQNLSELQQLLAQREKELTDLRACLDTRDRELNQLRPRTNQLCCEVKELRDRLAAENQSRVVAEERSKQLSNQFNFDRAASCEANKDLKERLAAANDIIACMEKKIAVLTEWAGRTTDTAAMLRALRDGTCRELQKYKQEAESALDCVIDAMRCQRDSDGRNNAQLVRDKASLQECLREMQAQLASVQAQLAACCQDKTTLEASLQKEKTCAQARITDLEQKLSELTDLVACKVKDATVAREAQAAMNSEVNTYRTLLVNQEKQLSDCAPCVPCKPRPHQLRAQPQVPCEPFRPWCDRADMPSNCAPCVSIPPPSPCVVQCRPENTYYRPGDYPFPGCGSSRQPCGSQKPFKCPKGKPLSKCDCPRPSASTSGPIGCCGSRRPGDSYQTTYMKSYNSNKHVVFRRL